MAATDIIRIICPNLYNDADINDFIALAQLEVSSCYYGTNYQQALALYASHVYTLSQRNQGAPGSISNIKEGDLQIGYIGYSSLNASDYTQTNYGVQLLGLMKRKHASITVTGADYAGVSSDLYCEDS